MHLATLCSPASSPTQPSQQPYAAQHVTLCIQAAANGPHVSSIADFDAQTVVRYARTLVSSCSLACPLASSRQVLWLPWGGGLLPPPLRRPPRQAGTRRGAAPHAARPQCSSSSSWQRRCWPPTARGALWALELSNGRAAPEPPGGAAQTTVLPRPATQAAC